MLPNIAAIATTTKPGNSYWMGRTVGEVDNWQSPHNPKAWKRVFNTALIATGRAYGTFEGYTNLDDAIAAVGKLTEGRLANGGRQAAAILQLGNRFYARSLASISREPANDYTWSYMREPLELEGKPYHPNHYGELVARTPELRAIVDGTIVLRPNPATIPPR